MVDDTFAICHGTPIDEDAYIFGEIEALNVFRHTDFPITFFGHSHFPVIFALFTRRHHHHPDRGPVLPLQAAPGMRYLVNPGSVGQPRDGNPLASFAMFDSETRMVSIHRIPYQVKATQKKIMEAGLPRPWPTASRSGASLAQHREHQRRQRQDPGAAWSRTVSEAAKATREAESRRAVSGVR